MLEIFYKLGSPDIPTRSFSPIPVATGHSQPAPLPKEEGLSSRQAGSQHPSGSSQQDGGRKMDVFVTTGDVELLSWMIIRCGL